MFQFYVKSSKVLAHKFLCSLKHTAHGTGMRLQRAPVMNGFQVWKEPALQSLHSLRRACGHHSGLPPQSPRLSEPLLRPSCTS